MIPTPADLFAGGVIASWYLKPYQIEPYNTIRQNRFPFIEQSRRTGKTNEVLCYIMEELIKHPGRICRWCEPWKYQAREIVMPEIEAIQSFARPQDKFVWRTTDSYYQHRNGSRLYLRGINEDKGESARGPFSHYVVADEYGSWKAPSYTVNEVLLPQLLSTKGPLIRLSTPPADLGHKYYEDKANAIRDGRFCQRIIWDSEGQLYTTQQIMEIRDEVGGENSIAWRREFLCEEIGDPTLLVIPEFTDNIQNVVVSKIDRPSRFDAYVSGDSGFDDNTFALFGYYDFTRAKLVIEREYCDNQKTSNEHVDAWLKIEKELWGDPMYPDQKPQVYKRTLDADKQKIYDIMTEKGYTINRPHKSQKMASINTLREKIRRSEIEIHESCINLTRQLRVGMWKDEKKLDFQRTEGLGHLDGIAALMYMNRSINTHKNPYPATYGVRQSTHYIPAEYRENGQSDETRNFAKLFKR